MANEKANEPSEQTKKLLERTRAAKAKAGDNTITTTVIEDAKSVDAQTPPPANQTLPPANQTLPPATNEFVATGAEQFPTPPRIQNNETDNEPAATNDEFKAKTRTMSRTEAERERGRQIVQKNEEARERAQANRRREERELRSLQDD